MINHPRPDLLPALQEVAKEAAALNLYLAYNTQRGIRIFATTEPRDFFAPNCLAHLSSLTAVQYWLAGYAAGQGQCHE